MIINPAAQDVFDTLAAMGIAFRYCTHDPVVKMEDCMLPAESLEAVMPRNIFLTTKNESAYWLLILRPEAVFRTSDISKQLGSSRLSFTDPEVPLKMLHTLPGAVTPMGLIFDSAKDVKFAVDRSLLDEPALAFHPCVNHMSLAMSGEDFFNVYLKNLGIEPVFVDIHDNADEEG